MYIYYLYFPIKQEIFGPYSFKIAMKHKEMWDNLDEQSQVLKIVVNEDGEEVKCP